MRYQFFRKWPPAAIVTKSAISIFSIAVEIILPKPFGNRCALGFIMFDDALDVIALGRLVYAGDEIKKSHQSRAARPACPLFGPRRKTFNRRKQRSMQFAFRWKIIM